MPTENKEKSTNQMLLTPQPTFSQFLQIPASSSILRKEDNQRVRPTTSRPKSMFRNSLCETRESHNQTTVDQIFSSKEYDCQSNEKYSLKQSRLAITQNIEYFIDSQSSERSQLSFRSDVIELQHANSSSSKGKVSRATFTFVSPLTKHRMTVFQNEHRFKIEFVDIVEECVQEIYSKIQNKSNDGFDRLFKRLKGVLIDHPFSEESFLLGKDFNNLVGVVQLWIKDPVKSKNMVLSFDFLCSHIELMVVLVFYWLQLEQVKSNPLLSLKQIQFLEKNKNQKRISILRILISYIHTRSRELINNLVIQKLLTDFYKYLEAEFVASNTNHELQVLVNTLIEQLGYVIQKQTLIKDKCTIGKNFNDAHLDQLYDSYTHKNKFINQNLEDQITLLLQIDKRNFAITPLSRYYQTGVEHDTNIVLAQNHTYLTCWLLELALMAVKVSSCQGVKYCIRFYDLLKGVFKEKDYERAVFFINILGNIKLHLNNLYIKFAKQMLKERGEKVNQMIEKISHEIYKIPFIGRHSNASIKEEDIVILQQNKIFKIVQAIRDKFKSKKIMISQSFHDNIQDFAKKILTYRDRAEQSVLEMEQIDTNYNKTIKMNLNYRFLNSHIYQILRKSTVSQMEQYQKWKEQAAETNGRIQHSLWEIFDN